MKLAWIQPGNIESVSGGYIYNKQIITNLGSSVQLEFIQAGTDFPFPGKESIKKCHEVLTKLDNSYVVIIDSLILGTIPDLIIEFASKLLIVGLIHLPLHQNPAFENEVRSQFLQNELRSFFAVKALIVTSDFTKSQLINLGIQSDKIHIVSPGQNTILNKKKYPEVPNRILCVSKITESKGQLDLIIALTDLQQFEWQLTICGEANENDRYYGSIRNQINNSRISERIHFTGVVEHSSIEKYYRSADLFVLPSYYETYSMVIQEAMAFKVPIICTDSGALKITTDPSVSKLYSAGNIQQLEKHLYELFTSPTEYRKLIDGYSQLLLQFDSWKRKAEYFKTVLKSYSNV